MPVLWISSLDINNELADEQVKHNAQKLSVKYYDLEYPISMEDVLEYFVQS